MASPPKPARFNLQITLGNDAMQTGYDIAEVLQRAANELAVPDPPTRGTILDTNGNRVGSWHVTGQAL